LSFFPHKLDCTVRDVVEFLHRLAERCVELLDCAEAGLLLADAAGVLRVMASSSERSDALDLLQSQNEEGPCFECYRRGTPVFSEDLAAEAGRWPTFAPLVVEGALEERQVPAIKLEIAIGDVVVRTDTAIDGEQLSRVIRAVRASR